MCDCGCEKCALGKRERKGEKSKGRKVEKSEEKGNLRPRRLRRLESETGLRTITKNTLRRRRSCASERQRSKQTRNNT